MRARRSAVLVATAVAATLTLVGCSSASDDASSKPSRAVSAPADDASSAAPQDSGSVELTEANFIETVAGSMSGDASYHTTMTASANGTVAMTAEGDAAITGDDIAMAMTLSSQGMDMEVRVVDGIWYMNLGELTQGKFVKVDPSDDSDPMAQSFAGITDQMDPSASVEATKDAVVSVTKSGATEKLDGVDAQPYEVVVDTSKITGAMADTIAAAGTAVPDTFTYTYWVGPDNKPRKMVMDQAGTTTEMTMTDWGKKVSVEAPAASDIVEMPTS